MTDDIVARLRGSPLIPSIETDLQVVHGLAAELRDIAHDHARHDGFVKFSGTRWMSYYHSLDRILMEHDRRQAEIYKYADEIERLRAEVERLRRRVERLLRGQTTTQFFAEAQRLRDELAARCGDARPGAHTAGPSETFIPEAL